MYSHGAISEKSTSHRNAQRVNTPSSKVNASTGKKKEIQQLRQLSPNAPIFVPSKSKHGDTIGNQLATVYASEKISNTTAFEGDSCTIQAAKEVAKSGQ